MSWPGSVDDSIFYCVFHITLYKLLLHKATTRKRGEEKSHFSIDRTRKPELVSSLTSHLMLRLKYRETRKKKLNYFSLIFSSCVRPFSFKYSTGQARSSFINPSLFKVLSSVPAPHTRLDILSSHQHRKPTKCAKSKRAENVLDDQFESFSECAARHNCECIQYCDLNEGVEDHFEGIFFFTVN